MKQKAAIFTTAIICHLFLLMPNAAYSEEFCTDFSPEAQEALSLYNSKRYGEALALASECGNKGSGVSALIAGLTYLHGLGVQRNDHQAFYWFNLGANQGEALSGYIVAEMHWSGKGTIKDLVKAHMWLNLTATRDSENATEREKKWINKAKSGLKEIEKSISDVERLEATRLARKCVESKFMAASIWFQIPDKEPC